MGNAGDFGVVAGQVAAELLARSHRLPPGGVPRVIAEVAGPLGVSTARVYLADLQQRNLRVMPPGSENGVPDVLPVDSTTAGLVYQQLRAHVDRPGRKGDPYRVWLPLLDGSERLGVLELSVQDAGGEMLARYQMLASLAGLMIASKSIYSDTYAHAMRSQEMALQGELVWGFTASRTFTTDQILVAAALEPAYEVGGDAFDYALADDRLHVSVFDAVGHDLTSGLLTSVAIAACRSTRRAGGTLRDIAARADRALAETFGESRFVTALLCDLNVAAGEFTWIPCGHPPPLLIRAGVITELGRRPQLPLGLADLAVTAPRHRAETHPAGVPSPPVYREHLMPGDRLLLYTDGVTEGRGADGHPFGAARLGSFILRHSGAGVAPSETLRRLTRVIREYQDDRLSDDATLVLLEWMPSGPAASA